MLFITYAVSFDCSATMEKVKANYDKLTNLPIESMIGKLFAKRVITLEEKERIDSKPIKRDKMMFLLDGVIIPSLLNNIGVKFKGFLEVMEESDDPVLTDMAKDLVCVYYYYCLCYLCTVAVPTINCTYINS